MDPVHTHRAAHNGRTGDVGVCDRRGVWEFLVYGFRRMDPPRSRTAGHTTIRRNGAGMVRGKCQLMLDGPDMRSGADR